MLSGHSASEYESVMWYPNRIGLKLTRENVQNIFVMFLYVY